jgi:hypothetical protein
MLNIISIENRSAERIIHKKKEITAYLRSLGRRRFSFLFRIILE